MIGDRYTEAAAEQAIEQMNKLPNVTKVEVVGRNPEQVIVDVTLTTGEVAMFVFELAPTAE